MKSERVSLQEISRIARLLHGDEFELWALSGSHDFFNFDFDGVLVSKKIGKEHRFYKLTARRSMWNIRNLSTEKLKERLYELSYDKIDIGDIKRLGKITFARSSPSLPMRSRQTTSPREFSGKI